MRRIKVRFSLQRGENYMKWRVIGSDGLLHITTHATFN